MTSPMAFLTLVAVVLCLTSLGKAQYIGAVRCYVCRANVYKGMEAFADCPDIYDTAKTTITYCKACVKYVGAVSRYNGSATVPLATEKAPAVSRACYTDKVYNSGGGGVFRTGGLKNPAPDFATYAASSAPVEIHTMSQADENKRPISYNPGTVYICNDGDLCNSGTRVGTVATAVALVPLLLSFVI